MTEEPMFGTPSISEPEVAAAVRLLCATGDEGGAIAEMIDEPVPAIRGLATLAYWWGSRLYGSGGALDEALAAWQQSGDPMPPPARRPT
jgi:hypothetical protein